VHDTVLPLLTPSPSNRCIFARSVRFLRFNARPDLADHPVDAGSQQLVVVGGVTAQYVGHQRYEVARTVGLFEDHLRPG